MTVTEVMPWELVVPGPLLTPMLHRPCNCRRRAEHSGIGVPLLLSSCNCTVPPLPPSVEGVASKACVPPGVIGTVMLVSVPAVKVMLGVLVLPPLDAATPVVVTGTATQPPEPVLIGNDPEVAMPATDPGPNRDC